MTFKKDTGNEFMNWVVNYKPTNLLFVIKFYLYKKRLKNTVPDFYMLWHMVEFINTLEILFYYDNSNNSIFYAVPSKNKDRVSLHIKEIDYSLSVSLDKSTKFININLARTKGRKLISSMGFEDGSYTIESIEDELLFGTIENALIDNLIGLMNFYCKNK